MNNLQQIRKFKRLSQVELAELTGIAQPALSVIESGRHRPRQNTKEKIETALGTQVDWNLKIEEEFHRIAVETPVVLPILLCISSRDEATWIRTVLNRLLETAVNGSRMELISALQSGVAELDRMLKQNKMEKKNENI